MNLMKWIFCILLPVHLFSELGYVEPWGKDAGLTVPTTAQQTPPIHLSPLGKVAEALILFHHKVITHIDGPRSHYRPSSSTYMLEAIRANGFLKGYVMGCDRLLRENGDAWVYRKKVFDGKLYKWDPPPKD